MMHPALFLSTSLRWGDMMSEWLVVPGGEREELQVRALLRELQREIAAAPRLVGTLTGVFQVNILVGSKPIGTWHMVLAGQLKAPSFGDGKAPGKADVIMALEENDLIKLISGGLSGRKAVAQKIVTIKGDYALAQDMESLFVKAGGPQKAERFIRAHPELFQRSSKL